MTRSRRPLIRTTLVNDIIWTAGICLPIALSLIGSFNLVDLYAMNQSEIFCFIFSFNSPNCKIQTRFYRMVHSERKNTPPYLKPVLNTFILLRRLCLNGGKHRLAREHPLFSIDIKHSRFSENFDAIKKPQYCLLKVFQTQLVFKMILTLKL